MGQACSCALLQTLYQGLGWLGPQPRGTDSTWLRGGAAQGVPARRGRCGGCLNVTLSNPLKVKGGLTRSHFSLGWIPDLEEHIAW